MEDQIKSVLEAVAHAAVAYDKSGKKVRFIVVIIDIQGNIAYANDRFLEIAGCVWEETIGKNWYSDFMTAESLWGMAQAYVKSSNHNSDSALFEGELLTKQGQRRAVSFLSMYFRDLDGQITWIANIGEDSSGK